MKKIENVFLNNFFTSFQELWNFDKRLIFILIAEVFMVAVAPFPNIIFAGEIVDSITEKKSFKAVLIYIALMFGLNLFIITFRTLMSKAKSFLVLKLTNKFDTDVNQKCLNLDYESFNDSSMQDRIQMVNQAVRGNNYFTGITTVFSIISHIITLIGIVAIMGMLSMWMYIIASAILALQALLYYIRLKHDRKYAEDSAPERRKNNYVSQLSKSVKNKKDIVIFGAAKFILKKLQTFQESVLDIEKRQINESAFFDIMISLLNVCFQISAYILIGIKAFNGTVSIGDFTAGVAALINFMTTSSFVTSSIVNYNDNLFYIKQYKSFCSMRSKSDKKERSIKLDDLDIEKIEFEFRDVSFRYPNSTSYVLKNINLKINNKERLGIVGYNGAGKTTFTLLLTRMYDPTDGAIYLNGVDIRDIDYDEYQKIISTVSQDFSLLSFSLLENIALTDDVSEEQRDEILMLLKENGLSERLKKLYRGLDTPVTKTLSASGVDFSGGEQQKIAIVRALYKNSPILIFDEPTSALDPSAEHEVFQKFADMSKDKTTILISHRIYSTRFCDKIAVFDKGQIKEYGTYDQLIDMKGLYYIFYQQQAEYFK